MRLADVRCATLGGLLVTLFALAGCGAPTPTRSLEPVRTAEGLTVYLGVVPAALVRGHEAGSTGEMHSGTPQTPATHHVMVAVFETQGGARVTDATVTARIAERGAAPVTRPLESMTVAGATTFGNFFAFADASRPVAIDVRVARPGRAPVTLPFAYRHGD